ncbi:hypothetical protein, partial [Pseudomonas aeruginosa]
MSRLAPLSQCLHALRGTFERAIRRSAAPAGAEAARNVVA